MWQINSIGRSDKYFNCNLFACSLIVEEILHLRFLIFHEHFFLLLFVRVSFASNELVTNIDKKKEQQTVK